MRAKGVPPGLGSYATKEDRLDARLAWTLMGTQAVKGVEIGDGFALAGLRGSEAHDEILRDEGGYRRETNHAGGLEAGVSNGEEIVVRAAMKPLPTLMRPLRSADLETGDPAQALVERSDVAARGGARGRRRGLRRFRDRAGGAGEVRRRLGRGLRRRVACVRGADPLVSEVGALGKHLALIGFMGAGKSTIGREVAERTARPFVDTDAEIERLHGPIPELFERGEPEFRRLEEQIVAEALAGPPSVIALGGGAVLSEKTRERLRAHAFAVLVDVDVDDAWERVTGSNRPLARTRRRLSAPLRRATGRSTRRRPTRPAADADGDAPRGARHLRIGVAADALSHGSRP